jgi:hypothetical protein
MIASALGLILLPLALLLRRDNVSHSIAGRCAACFLIVGVAASIPSALMSEALPLARLGFLTQALLTLALLAWAVVAAATGHLCRHRRMMLRVSALLFGVIVLRLMVSIAAAWPANFDNAYAAIAWVSWATPLIIVETSLRRRGHADRERAFKPAPR